MWNNQINQGSRTKYNNLTSFQPQQYTFPDLNKNKIFKLKTKKDPFFCYDGDIYNISSWSHFRKAHLILKRQDKPRFPLCSYLIGARLAIWIRDLVKALQVIQEAGWSQNMRRPCWEPKKRFLEMNGGKSSVAVLLSGAQGRCLPISTSHFPSEARLTS